MKYRILTKEELVHFENELKQFLIVNGVHGEEWQKLNEEDPDKALDLVELFSDQILQRVYENIHYLEFQTNASCLVFKLDKQTMTVFSITSADAKIAPLDTTERIHASLKNHSALLNYFVEEKSYEKPREQTIHGLIESGCIPSSSDFWQALIAATA